MKHSEKPAGMTLAEALGINVDPKAPGGQPIPALTGEGAQRSSKGHSAEVYDTGFADYDALNHPLEA